MKINIIYYTYFALVVVGLSGFYLGIKYSVDEGVVEPNSLIIEEVEVNFNSALNEEFYFASVNGTKFYPWWCSAGNRIKNENKVYFSTEEEAIEAGYSISSFCNRK